MPSPDVPRPLSPPSPEDALPTKRRASPPPVLNNVKVTPVVVDIPKPASRPSDPTTPKPLLSPTKPEIPPAQDPPPAQNDTNDTDTIDMETFQQILDLDEDGTEFSKGMAWAYFSQADQTFKEMDEALGAKNLASLSSLGHFLKGSSAALGVWKVQASCEKIQHYGQLRDEETGTDLKEREALSKIDSLLGQVKKEYDTAEKWLKKYYDDAEELENSAS